jgi:hypothetical protein
MFGSLEAFDEGEETALCLFKTYRTFKQRMVKANTWEAFHAAGFEL